MVLTPSFGFLRSLKKYDRQSTNHKCKTIYEHGTFECGTIHEYGTIECGTIHEYGTIEWVQNNLKCEKNREYGNIHECKTNEGETMHECITRKTQIGRPPKPIVCPDWNRLESIVID